MAFRVIWCVELLNDSLVLIYLNIIVRYYRSMLGSFDICTESDEWKQFIFKRDLYTDINTWS